MRTRRTRRPCTNDLPEHVDARRLDVVHPQLQGRSARRGPAATRRDPVVACGREVESCRGHDAASPRAAARRSAAGRTRRRPRSRRGRAAGSGTRRRRVPSTTETPALTTLESMWKRKSCSGPLNTRGSPNERRVGRVAVAGDAVSRSARVARERLGRAQGVERLRRELRTIDAQPERDAPRACALDELEHAGRVAVARRAARSSP